MSILRRSALLAAPMVLALAACAPGASLPVEQGFGPNPVLPEAKKQAVPVVKIAKAVGWAAGETPKAAEGLKVSALASGLDHPRWLYVLPNGDVLVAETNAPERPLRDELLGLPVSELNVAANELRTSTQLALSDPLPSRTSLLPTKFAQLGWLGVSRNSLAALEPHVTVLPTRTTLNFNTASAQAICASVPGMDMAQARQITGAREREPFKSLADAGAAVPAMTAQLSDLHHGVRSNHFEVRGRLRLDNAIIEERSLVVRNNLEVRVNWRERFARP